MASSRSNKDRSLRFVTAGCAALAASIFVALVIYLLHGAWPAIRAVGLGFVTDSGWHPSEGRFNLLPMVVASVAVTVGAVLVAFPPAFLSAVMLAGSRPNVAARAYRHLLEVLAGIPSVIIGLWGLTAVVPVMGRIKPPGAGLATAILVLAVMTLPTMALLIAAAIRRVPQQYLEGAAALGLGRWTTLWHVIVPAARGGIVAAVVLAVGRAIGETMAVLMVCGKVVQLPGSIFAPVRPLTANIALEMGFASGVHRSALIASGLLLLLVVVALAGLAELCQGGWRRA